MGKPLSVDLRRRIVAFVEAGHSRRAAAAKFDVSPSFVVELMKRYLETGSLEPARQGRPPGGRLIPLQGFLIQTVEGRPDITMPELAELVHAKHGVTADPFWFSRCLISLGFSYKKSLIATERGRARVRRERHDWTHRRQPRMRDEPHRLVFLDETSTTTKMTRLRGRAPCGDRLLADAPRPFGQPDIRRGAVLKRTDRTLGHRRTHEPNCLRDLYRNPGRTLHGSG